MKFRFKSKLFSQMISKMLLLIILIMIVLFYNNTREGFCGCASKESFGWSCTFTPSKYPKVDMGTVRDQMANDAYMAWVNGARFYE
jgi:hypothetical protein